MSYNFRREGGACLSSTVRKTHRTGLHFQQMSKFSLPVTATNAAIMQITQLYKQTALDKAANSNK